MAALVPPANHSEPVQAAQAGTHPPQPQPEPHTDAATHALDATFTVTPLQPPVDVIVQNTEFHQFVASLVTAIPPFHPFPTVTVYACGVTENAESYLYHQAPHPQGCLFPQGSCHQPHPQATTKTFAVAINYLLISISSIVSFIQGISYFIFLKLC